MLKVLVADLEPIQRKSLKMLLQEKYRRQVIVLETDNGDETFEIIQNNSIDLVILDHRLIGLEGLACVKKILEIKPYQKLIIYTMAENLKEAYKALGIQQFLVKPLRPQILIDIISSVLVKIPDLPKRRVNLKMEEIIKYIDENLHEDLTLTYVAKQMGLSTYYVSKIFKKELGINFVKYITDRKMEKAKELLKKVEIPIVNIAFEMGYPEPSYFTKVFKRAENMTPSQYRNQHTRWN